MILRFILEFAIIIPASVYALLPFRDCLKASDIITAVMLLLFSVLGGA